MDVLNNKGVKPVLLTLVLVWAAGLLAGQWLVCGQSTGIQRVFTERDAELAGRITRAYPGLTGAEIASLFTAAAGAEDAEARLARRCGCFRPSGHHTAFMRSEPA
ncbi:hypothetical protein D1872_231820 [compost metagenome]